MKYVTVYELATADRVVAFIHDEKRPHVIELMPDASITAKDVVEMEREKGNRVVHFRWKSVEGDKDHGDMVLVAHDGTEILDIPKHKSLFDAMGKPVTVGSGSTTSG